MFAEIPPLSQGNNLSAATPVDQAALLLEIFFFLLFLLLLLKIMLNILILTHCHCLTLLWKLLLWKLDHTKQQEIMDFLLYYGANSGRLLMCMFFRFFSLLWTKGILPKIIPLQKPGRPIADCTLASSYRPISLLCILGKALEAIIASRISYMVEEYGLVPRNHLGQKKKQISCSSIG